MKESLAIAIAPPGSARSRSTTSSLRPAGPRQDDAGDHRRRGAGRLQIRTTSGPAIERAGDLASLLTNLEEGDVLFIDEIHRLPLAVEEMLYPAMEDFALDIILGKGPARADVRLQIEPSR